MFQEETFTILWK